MRYRACSLDLQRIVDTAIELSIAEDREFYVYEAHCGFVVSTLRPVRGKSYYAIEHGHTVLMRDVAGMPEGWPVDSGRVELEGGVA